ncbi:hypothetical protein ANTQUA_LOCUS527, partial [Anthophora quadrimaculata]
MTSQLIKVNGNSINDQKDQSKAIVCVKWSNLSERITSNIRTVILRKICSEIQIESNVNYDDLCGPWSYPTNLYKLHVDAPHPGLCIWKYFTEEDVTYLKKYQDNKDMICSFFEKKLLHQIMRKSNIFTKLLWEFFKFARLHLFSGKSISACLGIVYLTHLFFLSYPWWTAQEVYHFFYKTVLLHVVLVCIFVYYPPRSLEIFTVTECKLLFKLFHTIYIENLVLLHILCHPSYYFTLKLHNPEN